jgi:hypothetical protein
MGTVAANRLREPKPEHCKPNIEASLAGPLCPPQVGGFSLKEQEPIFIAQKEKERKNEKNYSFSTEARHKWGAPSGENAPVY